MKNNLTLFIVFISIISTGYSQKPMDGEDYVSDCYNYTWDTEFDKSAYESLDLTKKEATIVLDKTILTHRPKALSVGEPLRKRFSHQIYWINEESAIDKMNEIYLYQNSSSAVSKVLVRTIDKTGKVVEFDKTKLEEVTKDEGGSSYKILAIPGIEVGSWVEVLIEYDGFSSQTRILTREPFDVLKSQVIYVSELPNQVYGDSKVDPQMIGTNGYKLDSKDVLEGGRVRYTFNASDLSAQITDETYMHEYMECPKVDLTTDEYEWKNMSKGIFQNYLAISLLNRSGKVQALLTDIGARNVSELEQIKAIEKYIKEEITITQEDGPEFESPQRIIKKKVANTKGLVLLYRTLFDNLKIEFDAYLIYDKDYIQPDKELAMSIGLSDFIFYFPKSDVYVQPESTYYRVGKLANYIGGVNALILTDPYNSTISRSKYLVSLPAAEKEYNVDESRNRIIYNEDDENLTIQTSKRYFGDRAIIERGALNFMDDTEKEEHVKDALLSKMENATLTDVKTQNTAIDLNANSSDSVIYTGKIVTEDMLSPIGNGFLLNLPKVMGNQVSFYDEGERIHNVYSPRAKIYDHTIEFVIPDGYEVQGIENLVFDRNYFSAVDGESKHVSSFVSNAEIVDGVLTVKVHEFYEEGLFPKKEIDQYRSVVNAAYEFYIAQVKVVKK